MVLPLKAQWVVHFVHMRYGQCAVGFEGAGPHHFCAGVGDFSRRANVVGVVMKHLTVLNQGQRFEAEGFEQIGAAGFGVADTAGVAYTLIDFTQQHITVPVKGGGVVLLIALRAFADPPAQCIVGVAGCGGVCIGV